MKKKQFMTSVAMVAIVANGMIQTAPAETATEHSEGIQVVQNTSEVVSTGSVEEWSEMLNFENELPGATGDRFKEAVAEVASGAGLAKGVLYDAALAARKGR